MPPPLRALALAVVFGLAACHGAGAPVEAPAWSGTVVATSEANVVGVINLEAMREDPLFGPLLEKLARRDGLGVLLRASQIDVVADAPRGRATTWLAVVHGVDGPPVERDVGYQVGSPHQLPSGGVEYGTKHGAVVVVPGAWILGEGDGFERARASMPRDPGRISTSGRTLVASTVRGGAVPSGRHGLAEMTEGLREATVEVLGGSHLELVGAFRYVDRDAAKRAAVTAKILLAAAAARNDLAAQIARALVRVDFDVSGDTVTLRLTIDDDLRDVLRQYAERADR
jgi:hypothetical protein